MKPMNTPKKGLRNVGDDMIHKDPNMWDPRTWRELPSQPFNIQLGGFFQTLLWAPFNDPATRPSIWQTIVVMLLVFLGCLFTGWTLVAAYIHALAVAGDAFIRGILIALVSGGLFYATQLWTYESRLLTYIYPEHSLAMIATLRVGILTALGYGVFQFGGYAAAGGILRALNGVTPGVTNVATSSSSYILYWFGAFVIVFNFLFNHMFSQGPSETRLSQHRRASKTTAMFIFVMTVAFFTLGLYTYSSGLYVTGVIVTGDNMAGDASVVPWAFYVFVALFACPATAAIIYIVIGLLLSDRMPKIPGWRSGDYEPSAPSKETLESSEMQYTVRSQLSDGLIQRRPTGTLSVNY